MAFCPQCGKGLEGEFNHCPWCGVALGGHVGEPASSPERGQRARRGPRLYGNKWVFWTGGALALVVVAALGALHPWAPRNPLVGSWDSGKRPTTLTYYADGTFTYSAKTGESNTGTYQLVSRQNAAALKMTYSDGSGEYVFYRVSGDRLTLATDLKGLDEPGFLDEVFTRASSAKSGSTSSLTTSIADKTANWQTYDSGGLRFRYPPSWKLEELQSGVSAHVFPAVGAFTVQVYWSDSAGPAADQRAALIEHETKAGSGATVSDATAIDIGGTSGLQWTRTSPLGTKDWFAASDEGLLVSAFSLDESRLEQVRLIAATCRKD